MTGSVLTDVLMDLLTLLNFRHCIFHITHVLLLHARVRKRVQEVCMCVWVRLDALQDIVWDGHVLPSVCVAEVQGSLQLDIVWDGHVLPSVFIAEVQGSLQLDIVWDGHVLPSVFVAAKQGSLQYFLQGTSWFFFLSPFLFLAICWNDGAQVEKLRK